MREPLAVAAIVPAGFETPAQPPPEPASPPTLEAWTTSSRVFDQGLDPSRAALTSAQRALAAGVSRNCCHRGCGGVAAFGRNGCPWRPDAPCGAAVREPQRRSGPGILQRWVHRGAHRRARRAQAESVRGHRPDDIHALQGHAQGRRANPGRARRGLRSRRQRPAGGRSAPHHSAARGDQKSDEPLGRELRSRGLGRDRHPDRRRDGHRQVARPRR